MVLNARGDGQFSRQVVILALIRYYTSRVYKYKKDDKQRDKHNEYAFLLMPLYIQHSGIEAEHRFRLSINFLLSEQIS
jgi:hypothetical protein